MLGYIKALSYRICFFAPLPSMAWPSSSSLTSSHRSCEIHSSSSFISTFSAISSQQRCILVPISSTITISSTRRANSSRSISLLKDDPLRSSVIAVPNSVSVRYVFVTDLYWQRAFKLNPLIIQQYRCCCLRNVHTRCFDELNPLIIQQYICCGQRNVVLTRAFDEDSFDLPLVDDWSADENSSGYLLSSSDGEDSDGEIVLAPMNDVDLPSISVSNNDALTVTAHRLATLGRGHKKNRIKFGIFISFGLIIFLTVLLLYVDWCAWRIVRLPLAPFYLTRPFLISAILVSVVGYVCVPFFGIFKFIQVVKKEGPVARLLKKRVPTLGGLLFIPIGIIVARAIGGFSSIILSGAAGVTLAFAAIGLLDDILSLTKNQKRGLPAWAKVILEVAVGTWFSVWLDIACIPSPYGMKTLVPLPLGLMYLGRYYQLLTSFSFVSMGHGVELTNGLDGLASGTAALAFIGMSIAVLPICSDLSIFGASMAGSCVGFLLHNRYKASVYMGDIGSLALGGALAAMAACTGMFFPLLISSGIFVVEASSVMIQVLYFSMTKGLQQARRHFFRMTPIHHHLQLSGFKEPNIVAGAYIISSVLALLAGYVGLVSA